MLLVIKIIFEINNFHLKIKTSNHMQYHFAVPQDKFQIIFLILLIPMKFSWFMC